MSFESVVELPGEKISEREDQERRLSALLNSQETLEAIGEFSEKYRESVIGVIIEFWILFPQATSVAPYLRDLKQNEECLGNNYELGMRKSSLLIHRIAEEIALKEVEADDSANAIVQYISEKFFTNGFVFHSFNGSFSEQIRQQGLDPGTRAWDWDELKRIMTIGRGVGTPMLLGWGDINSEGKTSIGDCIDNIYRYGVVSPEWFAQFVCEGWHIGMSAPYDKKAFHKRDYASARRNIETWVQKNTGKDAHAIAEQREYPNLTDGERAEVLGFFEKYWAKFGGKGSDPKVALIPRISVRQDKSGIQSYTDFREMSWKKEGTLEECIATLLVSRCPDEQIQVNIPAADLRIIDLPQWTDIFPAE